METVYHGHLALLAVLVLRLQQDSTKSRRKGQGVKSRDDNRDGHGDTELTVERTRRTTHERHGDEHRCHNEGDGDDGARNLVHGVDRCQSCRLVSKVELGMDSLHNHDGIIDHNGNGKHKGGKCQQVEREAEHVEEEECTDQRHRNGNQRNEG